MTGEVGHSIWARSEDELRRLCGLPPGWPLRTERVDGEWILFRVVFPRVEEIE